MLTGGSVGSVCSASRPTPFGVTGTWATFVQTAVMSRNATRQLIRSMNGTRLISTSTALPPPPPPSTETPIASPPWWLAGLHGLTMRDHQVDHLDAHLVDVVGQGLGLAVQDGEPDETDDGRADAERGAVERLGDTFGEQRGLA